MKDYHHCISKLKESRSAITTIHICFLLETKRLVIVQKGPTHK